MDVSEGADVMHKLKEKELLKFKCKNLRIRQVGRGWGMLRTYKIPPDWPT
ncbi:hypothetical protein F2Q69_00048429 [Brassica cretica]|uniref:Uncharacterized protein n=1 Tax=Brassica cretica TaxID=69181 RepID=A0A8S9PK01_BRACR|nr:hypothetical protein F2Q69_00048429 [Brassica cretica]